MTKHKICTPYGLSSFDTLALASAAPGFLTVTDGVVRLALGDGRDVVLARRDCGEPDAGTTTAGAAGRWSANDDHTGDQTLARAA